MTDDDVRDLLKAEADKLAVFPTHTGFSAWCAEQGVSKTHASEFLRGKRSPTSDLLSALGLEYRIVRKDQP